MIKLILVGMIALQGMTDNNIGVVKNEHYIEFSNVTGYYSEDCMNIEEGSRVIVVGDSVRVIEQDLRE